MSGLALFDLAASSAAGPGLARVGESWVESLLSDLRYLQSLDASFGRSGQGQFDAHLAALLRGMYEEWARSAEAALERLGRLTRAGHPVRGADALRDEHGRVMAMLQVTPERIEGARRQIAQGQVISSQEVRNELRSAVRP